MNTNVTLRLSVSSFCSLLQCPQVPPKNLLTPFLMKLYSTLYFLLHATPSILLVCLIIPYLWTILWQILFDKGEKVWLTEVLIWYFNVLAWNALINSTSIRQPGHCNPQHTRTHRYPLHCLCILTVYLSIPLWHPLIQLFCCPVCFTPPALLWACKEGPPSGMS